MTTRDDNRDPSANGAAMASFLAAGIGAFLHRRWRDRQFDSNRVFASTLGLTAVRNLRARLSKTIFLACGVWLVGLGLYFVVLRPALLPEDLRYMGTSASELQSVLPGLARWTQRVFTVMGGFMAGAGVLTISVAMNASAASTRWTWIALALAGLFTVGAMSVTNFQLHSDFEWLLLVPSLLWAVGLGAPGR